MMIAKDLGINDFNCSRGWFANFKKRFCLKNYKLHGEAGSVDINTVYDWIDRFASVFEKYSIENIFNHDETALFYEQLSQRTYATRDELDLRGVKQSKKRVTVLVGASYTGEKLPIYAIGKFQKPRCFKGVADLPVRYFYQKTLGCLRPYFLILLRSLIKNS